MEHKPITIINTDNEDEDLALLDSVIEGLEDGMRERGEPVPNDGFRRSDVPPTAPPVVPGASSEIPPAPSAGLG